ncbi:MAG TPA: SRPBCC family protein [Steroidobacteraceae bacterium]
MAERTSTTEHGDAPLSAAKNPNPAVLNGEHVEARKDDVLVGRSVTIDRPRAELFVFWRDFANLPRFMHNIQSVTVMDTRRSHWVVEAPAGKTVEWDAEIIDEEPGALIAWRSLEGASVRNSGRVEFRDSQDGRGTVVTVTIVYDPPGGALGKLIAKLFQKEPKIQARQDLRRFKQLMETGEISTAAAPDVARRA